jgi:hypothetical protein
MMGYLSFRSRIDKSVGSSRRSEWNDAI